MVDAFTSGIGTYSGPTAADLAAMNMSATQYDDLIRSIGTIDPTKFDFSGLGNLNLIGGTYSGPTLKESDYLYTAPTSNKGNPTSLIDTGGNTFAVMPGQEVRLVDTTSGKVVYQGTGKEAANQIIKIASGISESQGNKAGWEIQTGAGGIASEWGGATGAGTPWTTVAKEKVNQSTLDVGLQVLSVAAQIGVAVATSGASLPAQMAAQAGTAAAFTVAQGGDLGDAIKAGIMAAAPVLGAEKLGPVFNEALQTSSNIVGKALGAGLSSSTAAALTGQDVGGIVKAGLSSAAATYIAPDVQDLFKGSGPTSTSASTSGGSTAGDIIVTGSTTGGIGGYVPPKATQVTDANGDIVVTGSSVGGISGLPSYTGSYNNFDVPKSILDVADLTTDGTDILVNASKTGGIGSLPSAPSLPQYTPPGEEIIVTGGKLPVIPPPVVQPPYTPPPEEILVTGKKEPVVPPYTPPPEEILVTGKKEPVIPPYTPPPYTPPGDEITVTGKNPPVIPPVITPPVAPPTPPYTPPPEEIVVTGEKPPVIPPPVTPPTSPPPYTSVGEEITVTGKKPPAVPPPVEPPYVSVGEDIVVTGKKPPAVPPPVEPPFLPPGDEIIVNGKKPVVIPPFEMPPVDAETKKWTWRDWLRLALLAPVAIKGISDVVGGGDSGTLPTDTSGVTFTQQTRQRGVGGFDPFTYGQAGPGYQTAEYEFFKPYGAAQTTTTNKPPATTNITGTTGTTSTTGTQYTQAQADELNRLANQRYAANTALFNTYQDQLAKQVEAGTLTLDQAIAQARAFGTTLGGVAPVTAAEGGYIGYAGGGAANDDVVSHLIAYRQGGGHNGPGRVKGIGSGQDDKIPAWLSDGEYVWSAQDVADLGDGSTDEGVRRLDKMRQMVRKQAGRKDVKKIAKPQKGVDHMLKAVGGMA